MISKKATKFPAKQKRLIRQNAFQNGINNNFNETGLNAAEPFLSYNFDSTGGELKKAKGYGCFVHNGTTVEAELFGEVSKLWQYRRYAYESNKTDDILLAYCQGRLYYYKLYSAPKTNFSLLTASQFTSVPDAVNYRLNGKDSVIVCSPTDSMFLWDGNLVPERRYNVPQFVSLCIHYERLFAIAGGEQNTLWFSDDLDPTNWDVNLNDAGFITLSDERGKLRKLISFLDYLYVFRDFGITRLTAFGDQEQYSVSHLFVSSGKINAETVVSCGDRILFLSSDGLYMFDGVSTAKILPELAAGLVAAPGATACFHAGKYYLACSYDYGDGGLIPVSGGYANNTLLEYDIKSGTYTLMRGPDISGLCAFNSESYSEVFLIVSGSNKIFSLNDSGTFFGIVPHRAYHTGILDFGRPDVEKSIKSLTIDTGIDITVSITADEKEAKTVRFLKSEKPQSKKIDIRGTRFKLKIESDDESGGAVRSINYVISY